MKTYIHLFLVPTSCLWSLIVDLYFHHLQKLSFLLDRNYFFHFLFLCDGLWNDMVIVSVWGMQWICICKSYINCQTFHTLPNLNLYSMSFLWWYSSVSIFQSTVTNFCEIWMLGCFVQSKLSTPSVQLGIQTSRMFFATTSKQH